MIPCARFAFFTLVRDSLFVALAGLLLMAAFSFEPPLAFDIGAWVALIFAVGLLARRRLMDEERFRRSEAWRALTPQERPAGDFGPQIAREHFEALLLRFAQGASAIAAVLFASALLLSLTGNDPGFDAIVTAGLPGPG